MRGFLRRLFGAGRLAGIIVLVVLSLLFYVLAGLAMRNDMGENAVGPGRVLSSPAALDERVASESPESGMGPRHPRRGSVRQPVGKNGAGLR